MIRPLYVQDLSELTHKIPCGDPTFVRTFLVEYLSLSVEELNHLINSWNSNCEEIVFHGLVTWKKRREAAKEEITNQTLINILEKIRERTGYVKQQDYKYLYEDRSTSPKDNAKNVNKGFFTRWCRLCFLACFIFIVAISIFVWLTYLGLHSEDILLPTLFLCKKYKKYNNHKTTEIKPRRAHQIRRKVIKNKTKKVPKQNEIEESDKLFYRGFLPIKFTALFNEKPLNSDTEEALDDFIKLIKFRRVRKKRENDTIFVKYDLSDTFWNFDISDFKFKQNIPDNLPGAFLGAGGCTKAVDGSNPQISNNKYTVVDEVVTCPSFLLFWNLMDTKSKLQTRFEILKLLCLKAFIFCNQPEKMQQIIRNELKSLEKKLLCENTPRQHSNGMRKLPKNKKKKHTMRKYQIIKHDVIQ